MSKEIVMSFDLLGNSKIDAQGFTGTSCEDATRVFVHALNAKSEDDQKKPEYGLPSNSGQLVTDQW